jgi:hypothetical protein
VPPGADNPFLHDRVKTFQPRNLWEWLLQLAIVLFVADVGVRRIYLDRAEWLKATENLRRLVYFWRRPSAPPAADESLNALLARRSQVRAQRTGAGTPRPELFQPTRPAPAEPTAPTTPAVSAPAGTAAPLTESAIPPPADRTAVTSRLLEAKRRAAKKLDQS